jgi:hypothetical protein
MRLRPLRTEEVNIYTNMKYTINHTDLKRFIFIYLSKTEYVTLGGKFTNELTLRRKGNEEYVYDDYIYTYDDKRLLVETNLVWTLVGLFNISEDDALEYIGEWFEITYKVPVEEIIDWI